MAKSPAGLAFREISDRVAAEAPSGRVIAEGKMNDFMQLYTSMEGRINRQRFWLGIVGLIVAYIVVGLILGAIFGVSMLGAVMTAIQNPDMTAEQISEMAMGQVRTGGWVSLVTLIILAYPGIALMMKRSHDRDSSGTWVYVYYGLSALMLLGQALGLTYQMNQFGDIATPGPNTIGWILSLAIFILGLYLIVTLGFLKGTEGSNQYGPDPLGGGGDMGAGGDMGSSAGGGEAGGGDAS